MNQKTTLTVGCLSAALLCAPAYGGDFQGRWYVGLGAGVSQLEPNTDESDYELDDTEDTSVKLVIGRDLTDRFSAEVYFADLGEVTFTPKDTAVNPVDDPYVSYAVGGAQLVAYLYNSDGADGLYYRDSFAVFAKIGIGAMDNDSNHPFDNLDDFQVTAGLGAEGLISKGVSWRAEVDVYDEDAMQASLSLVKRFGAGAAAAPVVTLASTPTAATAVENVVMDPVLAADRQRDTLMGLEGSVDATAKTGDAMMTADQVDAAAPSMDTVIAQAKAAAAASAVASAAANNGADSDDDGVMDAKDRCPRTEAGLAVDVRGCAFSGIVEGLYFDRSSAKLSGSAKAILDNVVLELLRFPSVVLEVQAHTDNRGKAADNLALSQRRAEAVANYMVSGGVGADRIRARGFGESRPAFRNATADGRRRNRRVVFQTVEELR